MRHSERGGVLPCVALIYVAIPIMLIASIVQRIVWHDVFVTYTGVSALGAVERN